MESLYVYNHRLNVYKVVIILFLVLVLNILFCDTYYHVKRESLHCQKPIWVDYQRLIQCMINNEID